MCHGYGPKQNKGRRRKRGDSNINSVSRDKWAHTKVENRVVDRFTTKKKKEKNRLHSLTEKNKVCLAFEEIRVIFSRQEEGLVTSTQPVTCQ